ncbi:MAG TPA: hypothetical protein VMF65_22580 [Acidimicrobiales bacterium]|nr:hypothetical protein [Acidimicrobiales bacterium]
MPTPAADDDGHASLYNVTGTSGLTRLSLPPGSSKKEISRIKGDFYVHIRGSRG